MERIKKIYICWKNMRQRCNNKNVPCYKYYGGKGIKVCKEWNEYKIFQEWAIKNGYKENLTLDRIDNSKDYCPDNCRWITLEEQANNKTNNCLITYKGQTKTIHQWAKIVNINADVIKRRLKLKWDIDRIMKEKPYIGKNQYYNK